MKYIIVYLLLIYMFFIAACGNLDKGKARASDSIQESKVRNVYIKEKRQLSCIKYTPIADKYRVNEVWFENHWAEGDSRSETIKHDGIQFIATIDNNLTDSFTDSIRVDLYSGQTISNLGIFNSKIHAANFSSNASIADTISLFLYYFKNKNEKTPIELIKFN